MVAIVNPFQPIVAFHTEIFICIVTLETVSIGNVTLGQIISRTLESHSDSTNLTVFFARLTSFDFFYA